MCGQTGTDTSCDNGPSQQCVLIVGATDGVVDVRVYLHTRNDAALYFASIATVSTDDAVCGGVFWRTKPVALVPASIDCNSREFWRLLDLSINVYHNKYWT